MALSYYITAALLALCFSTEARAQDLTAQDVMDKAYSHIFSTSGTTLKFTLTSLSGKTEQGSTSGTLSIKGKRFCLKSDQMLAWFDGTRQWTMQTGDREVSLTEPTEEEQRAANPCNVLQLYKQTGMFKYKMKAGTLSNGAKGYKIFMNANSKSADPREVFVEIDSGFRLVRLSFREGSDQWTRIVVSDLQANQQLNDSLFTFHVADYPNALVVDLR
ncbi:MAG: hypothetical protein LUC86_03070 [Prevotellaceae bacterium]|nr:hypothetical protein [Prevotellaceae bacterium]